MTQVADNLGFDAEAHAACWRKMSKGLSTSPTSANFDKDEWRKAAETADQDSSEYVLATSGYWLGARLQGLRDAFSGLFAGFTVKEAIQKSVGYANAIYLKNRIEFRKAVKAEAKRLGLRSTLLAHTTVKSTGTQQIISEDHLITTAIDALSHTLFYAKKADKSAKRSAASIEELARVFNFSNIEFVYRAIWFQAVWEGYRLQPKDGDVYHMPPSEEYGAWWPVWDVRRQNIIAEGISVLSGDLMGHLSEDQIPADFRPLIPDRIIEKVNWRDGCWCFRTIPIVPKSREYRSAVLAAIGIRETSLMTFGAEVIPQFQESRLTLGHVLKAWHVIEWALEAVASSTIKKNGIHVDRIDDFSLRLDEQEVIDLIVECAGLSVSQARDAILFLSIDLSDDRKLFNKGVWANPILRVDSELSFVMAVFVIGNIVRAFEHWIERAEFARSGELKGSGFEGEVVRDLSDSAAKSELPVKVCVSGPNLKIAGEEIDGLVRIGSLILVLECKNFLTPGDSLERFNTIKRLQRGADQAARKAKSILASPGKLPVELEISKGEVSAVVGLVVSASPYGVGLKFGEVSVVDLSYLSILLQSLSYVSAMAKKGGKLYQEMTHIYEPFGFSIPAFLSVLRNPFVQRRYMDALRWHYEPFPSGDPARRLLLPFPLITAESDAELAQKMFAYAS